ncbi:MAG TPA: aminotransferase class I/II-fold pyridoxal phosphate-dependent enzyme [Pyrinomonadaceae bacterium]|nr:aminotransferase class I/II-fold pyridoxal phosphate-dependent enzyme [Pyrinomonadaceae bacterium]
MSTALRPSQRVMSSAYMHWAKTESQATYNLASSGVKHYSLEQLRVELADLELSGVSTYGYAPLQEAIAAKCRVTPDSVVAANGTSMANFLAMATLIAPGDEVLIEQPTYELILSAALYLGADVKRFARRAENNFRLDPSEVARAITPRTKLIVVTNMHNPSNAYAHDETLSQIGDIAAHAGAQVLVDEVYLDAAFSDAPQSAFHLGEHFITTNSLTKVYGLSGLRCGWILAAPALAERMWRLNDLFGAVQPHPSERLSCIAFARLPEIAAHSRSLLERNRVLANNFFQTRDDIETPPITDGMIAFPRLRHGSVDALCALLREKYETSLVPGKFFEMPEHFRLSIGGDTEMLGGGLERLGAALDEIKS